MNFVSLNRGGRGPMVLLLAITALAIAAVALSLLLLPASAEAADPDRKDAPSGLDVSPGPNPGELVITWDAHPDGAVDYRVRWKIEGRSWKKSSNTLWNAFPTTNQHTVTGLTQGTRYKAQVRARFGEDDNSNWSSSASATPAEDQPDATPVPTPTATPAPTPTEVPREDPKADEQEDSPRGHSSPMPWSEHTVHDIDARQMHELTADDGAIWYRLPNLVANNVYFIEFDHVPSYGRSEFTDKTNVRQPKLTIYENDGDPLVQNGHPVEAGLINSKKAFGYERTTWLLPFLYFIPETGGTYYLSVTSKIDDTGGAHVSYKKIWSTSRGDEGSTSPDCDTSFYRSSNSCRLIPTDTEVEGRVKSSDATKGDRYWLYPQVGVTYKLCLTTTEHAYAHLTHVSPGGELPSIFIHKYEDGPKVRTECKTFTKQYITQQVQYQFGAIASVTANPRTHPLMTYTITFEPVAD